MSRAMEPLTFDIYGLNIGEDHLPSMKQLAQALSDLIRRWLEPEQLPKDTTAGKQALGEWLEHFSNMKGQRE